MPNFLRTLSHRLVRRPRGRPKEHVDPTKSDDARDGALPLASKDVHGGGVRPSSSTKNSSNGSAKSASANCLPCKVMLLDSTDINISVDDLIDKVFESLEIFDERDYFGLQFLDLYHVHHWLDPLKKIQKQTLIGPPYTFRLRVKFYSSEPGRLRDELTRYQFFLQLKSDVQSGRLECPLSTASELAALALQYCSAEFGDYNSQEHDELFVSEFRFHPSQEASMERAILAAYGSSLCRGLSPTQAETAYLERVKSLDFYGVDVHTVEGKDGNEYRLGLTPHGMLVFDDHQKIGQFLWQKIQKLDFHDKKLTLAVEEEMLRADGSVEQIQLHTFVFDLSSAKACKHLWKCAIEYHTFFRLKSINHQQPTRAQFFRLGSTFRYRGRTEYENTQANTNRANGKSRERRIERKPSQRFAPRQRRAAKEDIRQQPSPPAFSNLGSGSGEDSLLARDQHASNKTQSSTVTAEQMPAGHITLIRIERNDEKARGNVHNQSSNHTHNRSTSTSKIPKYLQQKSERTNSLQQNLKSNIENTASMENAGFCDDSSAEEDNEFKASPCYDTNGTSIRWEMETDLRLPSPSSKLPRASMQGSQLRGFPRNDEKQNHVRGSAANTHFSCLPVSAPRGQQSIKTSHSVPKSTRQTAN